MGKNAVPKVAIDAKNHMENHIVRSVSVLVCMIVPFYVSILELDRVTAKLYKFFHLAS